MSPELVILFLIGTGACLGSAVSGWAKDRKIQTLEAELHRLKDFDAALHIKEIGNELHLSIHYLKGAQQAEACAQRVREGIEWALERGVHAQAARPRLQWGPQ